jgi:CheY-like chemotaxis protein
MGEAGRTYRLTELGRTANDAEDRPLPADYRRILGLIGPGTQLDVIRGALRRFPDRLIKEWLAELEELGYLESVPSEEDLDLDFTRLFAQPVVATKVSGEDAKRIAAEARAAGATLARAGAWIAEDRLANRTAVSRSVAGTTVLIVEDDPDQMALVKLRVSMAGYPVRIATNARELLDDLRTKPLPDLLLLDVMLPDGSGFDILGKLRKHAKFALMPVVLLTAEDNPQEIAKGLALGADAYVTKPYSKNILADTIGRVLKMK